MPDLTAKPRSASSASCENESPQMKTRAGSAAHCALTCPDSGNTELETTELFAISRRKRFWFLCCALGTDAQCMEDIERSRMHPLFLPTVSKNC